MVRTVSYPLFKHKTKTQFYSTDVLNHDTKTKGTFCSSSPRPLLNVKLGLDCTTLKTTYVCLCLHNNLMSHHSPAAWSRQTTCQPDRAPPCQPREPGRSGYRPSVRCPKSEGWSTGKEHTPTVHTNTATELIWLRALGKDARKLGAWR